MPEVTFVLERTFESYSGRESQLPAYEFISPDAVYPLPGDFDVAEYFNIEQELWALFPETFGKRVNFCQLGLTAQIYIESSAAGELQEGETYFLMPCADRVMRPVRMRPVRRLTLSEYRMSHLTAHKLFGSMQSAAGIMAAVHEQILGAEVLGDIAG